MKTKTFNVTLTAGGKTTVVPIKHYSAELALDLAVAQLAKITAQTDHTIFTTPRKVAA